MSTPDTRPHCDFCGEILPAQGGHVFRAIDAVMYIEGQARGVSRGGWHACETCEVCVRTESWESLADRTIANLPVPEYLKTDPVHKARIRATVMSLHRQFKDVRL